MRDDPGARGGGLMGGPGQWSVLTWLLVINGAVYLVQHLLLAPANAAQVGWDPWGGLTWAGLKGGHVYQMITYMFVHGSLLHLLFNGVGIFFLGRALLPMLGSKNFLMVYFGAGILAGICELAFAGVVTGDSVKLFGASGCAYGLLCALAALLPNQVVTLLLFFVIPVRAKLKTIAWVAVGIGIFMTLGGLVGGDKSDARSLQAESQPQIGHVAHLGGALFGWLFIAFIYPRLERKQGDDSRRQRWGTRFGASKVVDATYADKDAERRRKKRERKRNISKEVDAILDKINEQGFQSLTAEEKKILDESADKLGK